MLNRRSWRGDDRERRDKCSKNNNNDQAGLIVVLTVEMWKEELKSVAEPGGGVAVLLGLH